MLTIKGKPRVFLFHRLLAETFLPNPDNLPVVDHIDRDKHNDALSNLRWVSRSDNSKNINVPKKAEPKRNVTEKDYESKEWRPILGASGYKISQDGEVVNLANGLIIKPQSRNGYYRYRINNQMKSAHRLVWEAFNGREVPEGYQVGHINGVKNDNRVENLRVVTRSENMRHAYERGHQTAKVVKQYTKAGELVTTFPSYQRAADAMQVTEAAIRSAVERKGTCGGYYWLLDGDSFESLQLDSWAPEGFVILPNARDYCANKEEMVLGKRAKKPLKVQYYSSGTPFVQLHHAKLKVQDIIEQVESLLP